MRNNFKKAVESSCVITAENAISLHFVGFFTSSNEAMKDEWKIFENYFSDDGNKKTFFSDGLQHCNFDLINIMKNIRSLSTFTSLLHLQHLPTVHQKNVFFLL